MTALHRVLIQIGQVCFDWILLFPRDLRLVILALLTSGCLLLLRRLLADQDCLKAISQDLRTLKSLMAKAKRDKDKALVMRYRRTSLLIRRKSVKTEARSIYVAIVPLMVLGMWAWNTLAYQWPAEGESVSVLLHAPASSAGEIVHLVPAEGLTSDRWITVFGADDASIDGAVARWSVAMGDAEEPLNLVFRSVGGSVQRVLVQERGAFIGPQEMEHGGGWRSEVHAPEARLFGLLPGLTWLGLPAWATGYLLLVLLAYPGLRRLLQKRSG